MSDPNNTVRNVLPYDNSNPFKDNDFITNNNRNSTSPKVNTEPNKPMAAVAAKTTDSNRNCGVYNRLTMALLVVILVVVGALGLLVIVVVLETVVRPQNHRIRRRHSNKIRLPHRHWSIQRIPRHQPVTKRPPPVPSLHDNNN